MLYILTHINKQIMFLIITLLDFITIKKHSPIKYIFA